MLVQAADMAAKVSAVWPSSATKKMLSLPTKQKMMDNRLPLKSGITISELNKMSQSILPGLVELIINGYGDKDGGWETSLFSH